MKHLTTFLLASVALCGAVFAQTVTPPPLNPPGTYTRKTTALSRTLSMMADAAPVTKIKRTIPAVKLRPALGQGQMGACVGFSYTHWLNATPANPWYNLNADFAIALYRYTRDHDWWTDNDGDDSAGTMPDLAEIRLKQTGYVSQPEKFGVYYEKELRTKVLTLGPGVLGMDWVAGMDVPDKNGGIHLTGPVRGGHAILIFDFKYANTVNVKGRKVKLPDRYYFQQSWVGYTPFDEWNQIVWISAADMRRVLNRGGCVDFPTKAKERVK